MKKRRRTDDDAFARLFPTRRAWPAGDEAVSTLDPHDPFYKYIDAWIAAYKAAGGKTEVV